MKKIPDMLNKKCLTSGIIINGDLYTVGGYGLKKCEKYDVVSETWYKLPSFY